MPEDLLTLPLAALAARYRALTLSPVEVAQHHLARIESLEPRQNAFQIVDPAGALAMARASEARFRAGSPLSCAVITGLAQPARSSLAINWGRALSEEEVPSTISSSSLM